MPTLPLLEQISLLASPLIETQGLTLWGAEYAAGPHGVLRLYVEGPEGVTIAQCAEVSRMVGLTLDVEDIIADPYVLEVSSPGLERDFFKAEQLCAYIGQSIVLTLKSAPPDFPRRKNFSGKLKSCAQDVFTLLVPGEGKDAQASELQFAWGQVKKAYLQHFLPVENAPKGAKKNKPALEPDAQKSEKTD